MKKNKYRLITSALALSMIFCAGCGKSKSNVEIATESDATQTDATTQESITLSDDSVMRPASGINVISNEGFVINELTGLWIDESLENQRPVAVMVNNIDDAIPQSGISEADVIYEMIAEGGITRFMCLFKDYENLPKTGSVRSARQYFVQVANMYNAIYAHVGGSKLGKLEIANTNMDDLDGLSGAASSITFYRDSQRVAPHNCYTDGAKIVAGIEADGYSREYTESNDKVMIFNTEDTPLGTGNKADTVTIGFRSAYKPYFEYNEDDGVYYRFEYGGAHMDEYNNTQVSFKNVVVMFAEYTTQSDGRNTIDFDKGGAGYYVTDGEYVEITWRKDNGVIKFYGADGTQMRFNPGKTFVEVFKDSQPDDIIFE